VCITEINMDSETYFPLASGDIHDDSTPQVTIKPNIWFPLLSEMNNVLKIGNITMLTTDDLIRLDPTLYPKYTRDHLITVITNEKKKEQKEGKKRTYRHNCAALLTILRHAYGYDILITGNII
jgi:hypothetical protein